MADELKDKRITQIQADVLQRPIELDFEALFKVMRNSMVKMADDYEGTPEGFIQEVLSTLDKKGTMDYEL